MKIKREINGQPVEIELTNQELYEAYLEKQNMFDRQDIEDLFEGFDDNELKEKCGLTREQLVEKIPELAAEMRRNIDKYNMEWYDAREAAYREKAVI